MGGTRGYKYLTRLRRIVSDYFDEGELRTLCFDLGVNYDDLPGSGKGNKARELVTYLQRHGHIYDLVALGNELRPNVDWDYEKPQNTAATWDQLRQEQTFKLGRILIVVCDFRNFSRAAREAHVGERFSEYVLQRLFYEVGESTSIYGSARSRRAAISRPADRDPRLPLDRGLDFQWKSQQENRDLRLMHEGEIDIHIQPARPPTFDLREIVGSPEFGSNYDGCCAVVGSVQDTKEGGYKAMVRAIWISPTKERTWLLEESFFDEESMVDKASQTAAAIAESILSHRG